jgi:hypothetical protein
MVNTAVIGIGSVTAVRIAAIIVIASGIKGGVGTAKVVIIAIACVTEFGIGSVTEWIIVTVVTVAIETTICAAITGDGFRIDRE